VPPRELAHLFPLDIGDGATLRGYTLDDAEELYELVEANRERLNPWMPWPEHTRGVEEQRTWIAQHLEDTEGLGIDLGGRLVGGAGLDVGPFRIMAEIGYWIDGAHEGEGLVTRAVVALTDLAFRHVGVHRLVIRAGVGNARSRAIPERLGFTYEGVLRGEGKGSAGYGFHDLAIYSMLEDEWAPQA
jgi:ribosomal-protein-serine acetyltransferase